MLSRIVLAAILCVFSTAGLSQAPNLKLPSFDHLHGKAIEQVDLTLGPLPISIARFFMDEDDPEMAAAKRTLEGLEMIRVRSFEFASDYEYSAADLDGVRKQLSGAGWRKLVHVRDRKEDEQVDVFLAMAGEKPQGLAVIASCPREFVIIHLVGTIELEHVADLQKQLKVENGTLALLQPRR